MKPPSRGELQGAYPECSGKGIGELRAGDETQEPRGGVSKSYKISLSEENTWSSLRTENASHRTPRTADCRKEGPVLADTFVEG